jgi:hypothetical protein
MQAVVALPAIRMEAAMAFGKRLVPPSGDNGFVAPPPDSRLREITYPWTGKPEQLACNMALGNFANNVKRRLVVDGRLHAETLMVGIGAVAGFSAQCAFGKTMVETGRAQQGRDFHVITAADGKSYMFGDALNGLLISGVPGQPERLTLGSLMAGAATQAGISIPDIPQVAPLFLAVAASVRDGRFGVIDRPDGHAPHVQPLPILNILWPVARKCLTGTVPGDRDWGAAAVEHWPLISSLAARSYFLEIAPVLDPRIAFNLLMEAAIIASKIQPGTVVDGVF